MTAWALFTMGGGVTLLLIALLGLAAAMAARPTPEQQAEEDKAFMEAARIDRQMKNLQDSKDRGKQLRSWERRAGAAFMVGSDRVVPFVSQQDRKRIH